MSENEFDLRKLVKIDSNVDMDVLRAEAVQEVEDGWFEKNMATETLQERIDRWILTGKYPSMSPEIDQLYRKRMAELQKEGRI